MRLCQLGERKVCEVPDKSHRLTKRGIITFRMSSSKAVCGGLDDHLWKTYGGKGILDVDPALRSDYV